MVFRGRHLVTGGQIDPKLQHLQSTTRSSEALRMHFRVLNSPASGHPLNISSSYSIRVACRVTMCYLALEYHCHSFDPSVRMHGHSSRLLAGIELVRGTVVEHYEWIEYLACRIVVNDIVHGQSVADPMEPSRRDYSGDLFHHSFQSHIEEIVLGRFKCRPLQTSELRSGASRFEVMSWELVFLSSGVL